LAFFQECFSQSRTTPVVQVEVSDDLRGTPRQVTRSYGSLIVLAENDRPSAPVSLAKLVGRRTETPSACEHASAC
jgi:hypothetical protein